MSEKDLADATLDLPTLASAEALAVVPGYTLVRMRDETPLARVYECHHERTGDFVTVLVLAKDIAADAPRKNRILRDNRLVMALRTQKHLLRILEVGEGQVGPYLVLEDAAAAPLSSRLQEPGRVGVLEALQAVRDAALGLEAAHQANVVHKDITPARLVHTKDGTLKLTGFGLAAPIVAEGAPEGLTGTPEVIAPELLKGSAPDARSDIYALGATLYWLITGKPIFTGSAAEVLAAQQKKPVPSISSLVPDAGITVVDILYRLLQKDPARRPQTAAEVAQLLEGAIARVQRESQVPAPAAHAATVVDQPPFHVSPTSSAFAAPPRAPVPPARVAAGRSEMATVPPTGASPFDAPSVESDPYVGQPTGVMGSLKQMSVTEILQTLEIGKKSARVDVQAVDGDRGTMHVHDGQIVHAATPSLAGEPAVAHLIKKKDGFFRIHYEKEPCERNITRPTQFVLLEAMRLMDEASAPPEPAPPPPAPAARVARVAPDTQTTRDELPFAPTQPAMRPAMQRDPPREPPAAQRDAVVVRRPPERVPLAKPRIPTGEGAAVDELEGATVPHAVGDGIERTPGAPEPRGMLEDATMPQIPTRGVRTKAAVLQAWRTVRATAVSWTAAVRARYPALEAELEERFAPQRKKLAKVHPRLAQLPLWQLGVGALTAVSCVLILLTALL